MARKKNSLSQKQIIKIIKSRSSWTEKLEALKKMGVAIHSTGGKRPRIVAYIPGQGWTHLVYCSELKKVA